MFRIIQNTSSAGAKRYYSTSDYYTEGQELDGLWLEKIFFTQLFEREQHEVLADGRAQVYCGQSCNLGYGVLAVAQAPDAGRTAVETPCLVAALIVDQCFCFDILDSDPIPLDVARSQARSHLWFLSVLARSGFD